MGTARGEMWGRCLRKVGGSSECSGWVPMEEATGPRQGTRLATVQGEVWGRCQRKVGGSSAVQEEVWGRCQRKVGGSSAGECSVREFLGP